ncbi:MAG: hypothetical protein B7Z55_01050 [Planctomycetales bacterium 12-60-4]|nr:MAG: hypothetical protein B7Z55_01050 [Planctomycetales bacterium 12-60-4]
MSELRQDPIVGRWVIIAPDRALRPNSARTLPTFVDNADDPFAEGREAETPGELQALRRPGTMPDSSGWRVRVVPNKYPAVRAGALNYTAGETLFRSEAAVGPHEVIIECPQFETCLSRLPATHVREVVWMYRERLRWHRQNRTCAHALVFKNKGVAGGATLAHVHAQLIGTPWVPVALQEELLGVRNYHERTGGHVFADLLASEIADGRRLVSKSERFAAICPFASRVVCETWIVPRFEIERFEDSSDEDVSEVADILRETLIRLDRAIPDLPYNYVIHSAPFGEPDQPGFRWHIEILPRVGNTAGFEWGGGCFINTVPPEDAARSLRAVTLSSH